MTFNWMRDQEADAARVRAALLPYLVEAGVAAPDQGAVGAQSQTYTYTYEPEPPDEVVEDLAEFLFVWGR